MSAWWCTRGRMVAVVDAPDEETAAQRSAAAFQYGHHPAAERPVCRVASSADLALWAVLVGKQAVTRCAVLPDEPTVDAPDLFGGDL